MTPETRPGPASLLCDERGHWSTARCALWLTLFVTLFLVSAAAFGVAALSAAAYSLLGTLVTAFTCWAGGPRLAQYLAPQVGAVAAALGGAKTDARLPDRFRDNESGEDR